MFLEKGNEIDWRLATDEARQVLSFLLSIKLVDCRSPKSNPAGYVPCICTISEFGKTSIADNFNRNFDKWFTRTIAVSALIISIISLLKP